MSCKSTVSFDPGCKGTRVAVILECPGYDEDHASPKHPAAGATGKNLRELLKKVYDGVKVRDGVCVAFVDDLRYDEKKPLSGVMVCNAHALAFYQNGPNGNSPGGIECKQVKWVSKQIKNKSLVLCFGQDAVECYDRICSCEACDKPNASQVVVKCCHIGNRCLNRLLPTELLNNINPKETNPRLTRLSIVSQYVSGVVIKDIPATVSFTQWLRCKGKSKC